MWMVPYENFYHLNFSPISKHPISLIIMSNVTFLEVVTSQCSCYVLGVLASISMILIKKRAKGDFFSHSVF